MKHKILYIPIFAIFIIGLYFFGPSLLSPKQKCPNDYANTDTGYNEQVADIDKWTNAFYDKHPGATLTDWSKARYQYWVDNKCTSALQAYKDYKDGKVASSTVKRINNAVQEAVNNKTQ